MTTINPYHKRIFHEYEITDAYGLHFASIVYVRELNPNNNNAALCDGVDAVMESVITNNCKVRLHKQARMITSQEEVEELNKRLREEYQLKAYFTFFSESQGVGKDMEYSRVTIHATILIREKTDVCYFDNVGYSQQVTYQDVMAFTIFYHAPSPIYTLQEHPLVHGIVCYKEATDPDILYLLYRHNDNPVESILATVDVKQCKVDFLQGTDLKEQAEILTLSQAFVSQNNYAPIYRYTYSKSASGYCVPTRIILNRERDKFKKAKDEVLNALAKPDRGIKYAAEMASYLEKMIEA